MEPEEFTQKINEFIERWGDPKYNLREFKDICYADLSVLLEYHRRMLSNEIKRDYPIFPTVGIGTVDAVIDKWEYMLRIDKDRNIVYGPAVLVEMLADFKVAIKKHLQSNQPKEDNEYCNCAETEEHIPMRIMTIDPGVMVCSKCAKVVKK